MPPFKSLLFKKRKNILFLAYWEKASNSNWNPGFSKMDFSRRSPNNSFFEPARKRIAECLDDPEKVGSVQYLWER